LGDGLKYRAQAELAVWKRRDPVSSWRRRLLDAGVLTTEDADRMSGEVEAEVHNAIEFAKASPFPEPAAAWDDLYAQ
jgi:TPP-dependent pyruvate/acetoin dehydrogenase alpha subunit